MLESLKNAKGVVARGLLAGAMLATAIGPAMTAHAATQSISVSPATSPNPPTATNHAIGDIFTMAIVADAAGTATRGWQANFTWNPAVVNLTDYQVGTTSFMGVDLTGTGKAADTFLGAYIAANPGQGLGTNPQASSTIDNTNGKLSAAVGNAMSGNSTFAGPTGTGQLMVLQFKTVGNGTSAITLSPGLSGTFLAPGSSFAGTLNNGTIYAGAVAAPSLAIQGQTTVAVTGTPTSYNVSFSVKNTGSANLATAVTNGVTVTITNGTPVSIASNLNALTTGTSQSFTVGPFALASGQTLSNVTISVSCGTNNPCTTSGNATTAYSYAAYTANGTTPVSATNAGVLVLTAPAAQSLTLSPSHTVTSTGTLNVQSNLTSFQVNVSGDNNGFLTEANGTTYVTPSPKQLSHPLQIGATASPAANNTVPAGLQNVTGTATLFVSGLLAGQDPNTGATFNTTFSQFDAFSDPSVAAPRQYYEVVTFAAAGSF